MVIFRKSLSPSSLCLYTKDLAYNVRDFLKVIDKSPDKAYRQDCH